MYQKENKILKLLALVMLFGSCSTKIDNINNYVDKNFILYEKVYRLLTDSIQMYTSAQLKSFLPQYSSNWQVDSLICFNSKNDKFVTTVNTSIGKCKECLTDDAQYLLGKKINGYWYFLQGSTLVIPRNIYGKDEMHPLSFHELSQIARKEMFGENALIKKNGELLANDAWIDQHFYNNGFYTFGKRKTPGMISAGEQFMMPRDKEKFDSVHWFFILDKWKHKIDTAKFKKQLPSKNETLP